MNLTQAMPIEDEVLNAKAEVYAEDLVNWDPATIDLAFRNFSLNSRYIPALSEIVAGCRMASKSLEYQRQREIASLPMPDHLPEEQRLENLGEIKRLRDRLAVATSMAADLSERVKPQRKGVAMTSPEYKRFLEKHKILKEQISQIMEEGSENE